MGSTHDAEVDREVDAANDRQRAEAIDAARRKRFNDILDGYEAEAGDWEASRTGITRDALEARAVAGRDLPLRRVPTEKPEASHYRLGPWAVVAQAGGGGYFVTNVVEREDVEPVAVERYHDGWQPVCFYDLDELEGKEPPPMEGDQVRHVDDDTPRELYVVHATAHTDGGDPYWKLWLDEDPDAGIDDAELTEVDQDLVVVTERAEPDTRMPVRFGLARVAVVVAFDAVASP